MWTPSRWPKRASPRFLVRGPKSKVSPGPGGPDPGPPGPHLGGRAPWGGPGAPNSVENNGFLIFVNYLPSPIGPLKTALVALLDLRDPIWGAGLDSGGRQPPIYPNALTTAKMIKRPPLPQCTTNLFTGGKTASCKPNLVQGPWGPKPKVSKSHQNRFKHIQTLVKAY